MEAEDAQKKSLNLLTFTANPREMRSRMMKTTRPGEETVKSVPGYHKQNSAPWLDNFFFPTSEKAIVQYVTTKGRTRPAKSSLSTILRFERLGRDTAGAGVGVFHQ